MIFSETEIKGVYIIEPEFLIDQRGFFARSFCKEEFQRFGLETEIVQCNISYNKKKGTLRGMHYQIPPFEEAKIITCTKGSIYDVAVDLRKDSSTYSQYVAIELSEKNFKMMYVPRGCAHGFLTVEDDTFVYYQMTGLFHPDCARGIRWDDPAIGIIWPVPPVIISEKDQGYMDLTL